MNFEQKREYLENPLLREKFREALTEKIHKIKGGENPNNKVSDKKLVQEAKKVGILKERNDKEQIQAKERFDKFGTRVLERLITRGKKVKSLDIKTGLSAEEIAAIKEILEEREKRKLPQIKIRNINLTKMKEGQIIEGQWKLPIKVGKIDENDRPSGILFINKQFTTIKFPKYTEKIVQKIIKKERKIPVRSFKVFGDKRGEKILVSYFDVLGEDRKKGKINKTTINKRIEEYQRIIEKEIKEGKITKEEAEREILSFMLPVERLLDWEKEIKEKFGKKEEIKLKNEVIKDLILKKKRFSDITLKDIL